MRKRQLLCALTARSAPNKPSLSSLPTLWRFMAVATRHVDLANGSNSWAAPIASIVPHAHTAETYGNASGIAGGGWSWDLCFWFTMDWSPEVLHCHNLQALYDNYIHINSLEFSMCIVQVAAIIVHLQTMPQSMCAAHFSLTVLLCMQSS